METTKVLTVIAVIAVVAATFGLIVNLGFLNEISSVGRASYDTGNASLVVGGVADIIFITNLINWSAGQVDDSQSGCGTTAILTAAFPMGSVTCGTWQIQPGLTLQNKGNSAVRVLLRSNNNAVAGTTGPFIGSETLISLGNDPELVYDWRVAQNQSGSCTVGLMPTTFTPVNYTTGNGQGTEICTNFLSGSGAHQLNIEFNVTIPTDAVVGTKLSQITAEAFVV